MTITDLKNHIDAADYAIGTLQELATHRPDLKSQAKIERANAFWLARRCYLVEQLEAKLYYECQSPPPDSCV